MQQPKHITQITELHKFENILPAIHVFNSLVLDAKLRWYSEQITLSYFGTQAEYDAYMQTVNNKTMDFGTIKQKIHNNKYSNSNSLFSDMELCLSNAMVFNKHGIWYDEADRLNKLLHKLKNKQPIKDVSFIPFDYDTCRLCPDCNNIFIAIKITQPKGCKNCVQMDSLDCFICYNHSDNIHSFCDQCVNLCVKKYQSTNNGNNNCNSNGNNHNSNGLAKLNLSVPFKPNDVIAVHKFGKILLKDRPILKNKIEIIIRQIRAHDKQEHFFKK
eukprot:421145_1